MQSLKLYWPPQKILISCISRQFQTNAILLTRFGKKRQRVRTNTQMEITRALTADDPSDKENFDEDEDCGEDFNFMEADAAYDEYSREKKKSRQQLHRILTAKKFFEPQKQPQMLTYAERECIKYLHQKDPIHWNVETLSESFPATTEIIKKILKSKWQCSSERQKTLDSAVQKNWELLAVGSLDADPKLIQHCKKFINRRQIVLDQLNNSNITLPHSKPKQSWNMGEMSGILYEYEKSIQQLAKPQDVDSFLLPTDEPKKQVVNKTNKESSLKVMHEKINKIASIQNLEGIETFLMKNMINRFQKSVTLENMEENVLKKAIANRRLNLQEKCILESNLGIEDSDSIKNEPPPQSALKERKQKSFPKNLLVNETTVKISEINNNKNVNEKLFPQKFSTADENFLSMPEPNGNTILVNESNLGKKLAERSASELDLNQVSEVPMGKKAIRKNKVLDSDAQKRQDLFFEKLVEDIKSTAFWNSCNDSRYKAQAELKKEPLGPFKDQNKVSLADVSIVNDYPQRIEIPPNKRGSGLTFKVKDCYYDDDGEFLYRVPGMTK